MGHWWVICIGGLTHRARELMFFGRTSILCALIMLLWVSSAAAGSDSAKCPSCGAEFKACLTPATCEDYRYFKMALELVNAPEKTLNDPRRMHDALILFQPFSSELTPDFFMEMLLDLRADARDYTPAEAFYTYKFLQAKRVARTLNPSFSENPAAWWQAISINSALRGKDYQLLQNRLGNAHIKVTELPVEQVTAVIERAVMAVSAAPAIYGTNFKTEEVDLSRAEADVIEAALLASAQDDNEETLKTFLDLHAKLLPEKSKKPLHQIERATKDLLQKSTADLDLMTAIVGLSGKDAVQGGMIGMLFERGKSVPEKPGTPENDPNLLNIDSFIKTIIENLKQRAKDADDTTAGYKIAEELGKFAGSTIAKQDLLSTMVDAPTAQLLVPLIKVQQTASMADEELRIAKNINAVIQQQPAQNVTELATARVYVNLELLLSQVLCVVSDSRGSSAGNVKILVDDGIVHFRDPGIDMWVVTDESTYFGRDISDTNANARSFREKQIEALIRLNENMNPETPLSTEQAKAYLQQFYGWTGEYKQP